ncbi:tryptophan synthase subunit alpha [Lacticaseibacillus absianus]|uniref:tryptophan synthase subunit alpha n=1 Tax=Lacticaseibacillus absianus TaxID=2729623 RepID=UPI0015CCF55F|nr:tryptophan synthase subunit alpha [Lacticaseibacillus absianus]
MTNYTSVFTNTALIPFQIIGDPDSDTTVANVLAEVAAGAPMIELGLPFTDPVADGPAVKAANLRALDGQLTVAAAFETIRAIHAKTTVPLVLVTYVNLPFVYGFEAFAATAAALGLSGVIVPDLPHEEAGLFAPALAAAGVDLITIVGPAAPDRIRTVVAGATGFLTLSPALPLPLLTAQVAAIRAASDLPIVVNTDATDPAYLKALAGLVDGVQLSSALVGQTDAAQVTALTTQLAATLAE